MVFRLQLKVPAVGLQLPEVVLSVTPVSPDVLPVTTTLWALPGPLFLTLISYVKRSPTKTEAGTDVSVSETSATIFGNVAKLAVWFALKLLKV
jgi:hypothetical protein